MADNEAAKARVPVPGSTREPLPNSKQVRKTNADERIEVTVVVKARSEDVTKKLQELNSQLPSQRTFLSREEAAQQFGASPEDIAKIEEFAHEYNLDVVQTSAARRSVVLSGTVADISEAFGVELSEYEHQDSTYRGRTGPVHVPAEIASIVEGVFGLDNRPQARTHFRPLIRDGHIASPHAGGTSYTPVQIAQLYNFPTGTTGQGQTIALIELGGGYRATDIKAYFTQLKITSPKVVAVSVDNGHNKPTGSDTGPDGEVMLDIEVAGAVAPGAQIVVYFAPNTDQGFLDAITTAIHDTQHKPSIISISWGGPESSWTQQALQSFDQAFQVAGTMGITVCCAAGDNGSTDGATDGNNHVDFPASSPHALACGGTSLQGSGNNITSETVWNDGANGGATGGGVSDTFPLPDYQKNAKVPPSANANHNAGRGVPDIAGNADPATGYIVRVDKQQVVFGGTSAVAPLWAGLLALINQQIGKPVGFLNPLLYGQLASENVMRDITSGNNGAYQASAGWDACTGWGSPNGANLLKALSGK